jgi:hypothetical protein
VHLGEKTPWHVQFDIHKLGVEHQLRPFDGNLRLPPLFNSGEFTPVLAKHIKSFNLTDTLAAGIDRRQRSGCQRFQQGDIKARLTSTASCMC